MTDRKPWVSGREGAGSQFTIRLGAPFQFDVLGWKLERCAEGRSFSKKYLVIGIAGYDSGFSWLYGDVSPGATEGVCCLPCSGA